MATSSPDDRRTNYRRALDALTLTHETIALVKHIIIEYYMQTGDWPSVEQIVAKLLQPS